MKVQTKISIIMPVYNTGKYLRESISSLVNQSFKDIELICVDDASDDFETKEILKEYSNAELPFRFEIIALNKRMGAANARNVGFKKATGVYTIFLDADDVFDTVFLEKMYTEAVKEDADVCVCGYREFYCEEDGSFRYGNEINLERNYILDKTREEWTLKNPSVPWNKLCKSDFLRANNIFFQNLSSCNDVFFSIIVMYKANNIAVLEVNNLIYYRINTSTQISANRNPLNVYYAIELIQKKMQNDWDAELLVIQCAALLVWGLRGEINRSKSMAKSKELYEKVQVYLENIQVTFTNKLLQKWKNNITNLSFESNWYRDDDIFQEQLELYKNELIKKLDGNEDIYLWGNGNRGVAFQRFCLNQGIQLKGVVDKKNKGIGNRTQQGFLIMNTDDIVDCSGIIVASNTAIYKAIRENINNHTILNLQEFCPI